MALKWRKKVILAKIEATYGVDPVPTGAANSILVSDLTIRPFEAETEQRNLIRPYLGNEQQLHVNKHVVAEFAVEAAGSGTVDVAPAYGPLLRACGFAETITVTTGPVEYDPVSANEESVTIYVNVDGTRHAMLGARGSVRTEIGANGIPHLMFRILGLWVAPSTQTAPVTDFSSFRDPLIASNDNTPTFTLHGFAATLRTLSVDVNVDAQLRDLIGNKSIEILDRKPSGQVNIEAPPLATKDFFAIADANTLAAVQLIHGTVAGDIFQLDAPQVQLLQPEYVKDQAAVHLQMGLSLVPTGAGDDEFKITTK